LSTDVDGTDDEEVAQALRVMWQAALERIDELEHDDRIDAPHAAAMRKRFQHQQRDLASRLEDDTVDHVRQETKAELDVIRAERAALIALRERGEIDNTTLRRLQLGLDLSQTRLERETVGRGGAD
jgi:hypothetical protein